MDLKVILKTSNRKTVLEKMESFSEGGFCSFGFRARGVLNFF